MRLLGPQPEAALRTGSVHIQGDAEVAQTFSELLEHARPDLEEELSRVIGDVAAHQVGNVARSFMGFAQRAASTFTQNVSEYLQEEGRDVPNRTEADEFIADVDKLRDDVDRIEARIVVLEAKQARRPGGNES
jgi:ubiquinone biosynthesis protein UbiJ